MNSSTATRRPARIVVATCSLSAVAVITTLIAAPSVAAAPRAVSAPSAGTCWKMTDADLNSVSYSGTKVPCSSAHVVETAGTVAVPASVAKAGRSSVAMSAYARQACRSLINSYTGFTSLAGRAGHNFPRVDKSTFAGFAQAQVAWFAPTSSQWANGERWASCAASSWSVVADSSQKLVPLKGSVRGKNAALALRLSTDRLWAQVATPNLATSVTEAYPGAGKVNTRAIAACRKLLGPTSWRLTLRDKSAWTSGLTTATCWHAPTRP